MHVHISKIADYLKTNGRTLERALFDFHFAQGSIEDVIDALKSYQNPDGGFGHGIEPDFNTPDSTPIGTWTAINILRTLPLKAHPMIDDILQYLDETQHQIDGLYVYTIPAINDHPHAPWWHFDASRQVAGYNPTASLLGYMIRHIKANDARYESILKRLDDAISYFMNQDVREMHELRCFVELFHDLPPHLIPISFKDKLTKQITDVVDLDTSNWYKTYTVLPSALLLKDTTPGYETLKSYVLKEHMMMLEMCDDQGLLPVTWHWGDQYPEAFQRAIKAWQGILALQMLMRFKTFDFKEVAL